MNSKDSDSGKKPPDQPQEPKDIVAALESGALTPAEASDLIERLPASETQQVVVELVHVKSSQYVGPIPSPEMLAEYQSVVDGSAETIIENWLSESNHRREMEGLIVKGEMAAEKRGQFLGAAVAVVIIVSAIVAAQLGHMEIGLAIAAIGALGIVTALIKGRNSD